MADIDLNIQWLWRYNNPEYPTTSVKRTLGYYITKRTLIAGIDYTNIVIDMSKEIQQLKSGQYVCEPSEYITATYEFDLTNVQVVLVSNVAFWNRRYPGSHSTTGRDAYNDYDLTSITTKNANKIYPYRNIDSKIVYTLKQDSSINHISVNGNKIYMTITDAKELNNTTYYNNSAEHDVMGHMEGAILLQNVKYRKKGTTQWTELTSDQYLFINNFQILTTGGAGTVYYYDDDTTKHIPQYMKTGTVLSNISEVRYRNDLKQQERLFDVIVPFEKYTTQTTQTPDWHRTTYSFQQRGYVPYLALPVVYTVIDDGNYAYEYVRFEHHTPVLKLETCIQDPPSCIYTDKHRQGYEKANHKVYLRIKVKDTTKLTVNWGDKESVPSYEFDPVYVAQHPEGLNPTAEPYYIDLSHAYREQGDYTVIIRLENNVGDVKDYTITFHLDPSDVFCIGDGIFILNNKFELEQYLPTTQYYRINAELSNGYTFDTTVSKGNMELANLVTDCKYIAVRAVHTNFLFFIESISLDEEQNVNIRGRDYITAIFDRHVTNYQYPTTNQQLINNGVPPEQINDVPPTNEPVTAFHTISNVLDHVILNPTSNPNQKVSGITFNYHENLHDIQGVIFDGGFQSLMNSLGRIFQNKGITYNCKLRQIKPSESYLPDVACDIKAGNHLETTEHNVVLGDWNGVCVIQAFDKVPPATSMLVRDKNGGGYENSRWVEDSDLITGAPTKTETDRYEVSAQVNDKLTSDMKDIDAKNQLIDAVKQSNLIAKEIPEPIYELNFDYFLGDFLTIHNNNLGTMGRDGERIQLIGYEYSSSTEGGHELILTFGRLNKTIKSEFGKVNTQLFKV